jgi:hypothetical protein
MSSTTVASSTVGITSRVKQVMAHPFSQLFIILVLVLIVFILLEYQMNKNVREVRRLRLQVMQKTSKESLVDTLGLREYYDEDGAGYGQRLANM